MARTKHSKPGSDRRRDGKALVSVHSGHATEAEVVLPAAIERSPRQLETDLEAEDGNHGLGEDLSVPAVSQAFKSSLDRFRHDDDGVATNQATPAYKVIRKRPLSTDAKDSPSPSPDKKRKQSSKYAPPSKYAHLPKLLDILEPDLICIFVGTNPGIRTATAGHAYAHPSNLFWKLLHSSGCTDVRLPPENDVDLPKWYCMGNTNIVERPSKDAAELSKAETAAGTPILDEKVRKYRPEAVCIVGKGIYDAVFRYRYGRQIRKDEFRWGWQGEKERMGKTDDWPGAPVFVTSSTSGSAASLKPAEKEEIWRPFGKWVKARRKERYGTEGRIDRIQRLPIVEPHDLGFAAADATS